VICQPAAGALGRVWFSPGLAGAGAAPSRPRKSKLNGLWLSKPSRLSGQRQGQPFLLTAEGKSAVVAV